MGVVRGKLIGKYEAHSLGSKTKDKKYVLQYFNVRDGETKGYGRIEDYIDDTPYMARNTAVISNKDYTKLKKIKKIK